MRRTPRAWAPYVVVDDTRPGPWRWLRSKIEEFRRRMLTRRVERLRPVPQAGLVDVHLAFVEQDGSDHLVAVSGSEERLLELEQQLRTRGVLTELWWRDLPLQDAETPHSRWPEPSVVHIVGEGGIDTSRGDTGYELEPLAVFTDIEGAKRFAAAQEAYIRAMSAAFTGLTEATESTVTLRTVPVGSLLI